MIFFKELKFFQIKIELMILEIKKKIKFYKIYGMTNLILINLFIINYLF